MNEWEHFVFHVLIELIVIIAAARVGAWFFRQIRTTSGRWRNCCGIVAWPVGLGTSRTRVGCLCISS